MKRLTHFLFLLLIILPISLFGLAACNTQQAKPDRDKSLEIAVTQTFDVYKDTSNSNLYHADSITTSSSYTGTLKEVVEGAINEVDSDGGGTLAFRAGVFDLGSDSIKIINRSNITFEGQGIDNTVVKNSSSDPNIDTEPFNATNSDDITIRGLTVSAGGSTRLTSDAIDGDGANNWLIENVKIDESRGSGIIFDGKGTGQRAENNTIRNCVIDSDDISGDGIELLAAKNNLIENCTITNISNGVGISINKSSNNPTQGDPNKKSNDNIIRNNTINNLGHDGIKINSGNRNTITGNTITNSGSTGIHIISSDGITCDGNIIEFNTVTSSVEYGLKIANSECNRTVVWDNNDFTGNGIGEIDDDGTNTSYKSGGGTGSFTFTPTDDATIQEQRPNNNSGNSSSIRVDANAREDTLLRFNVTGVGSSDISNVTLRVYATDGAPSGGDFVEVTNNSWNENTVTWNNAPAGNGTSLDSLGSVSPGNWYELDVTSLVDGDGSVSVRISSSSSSTNGATYASKENSNGNAPELVVTLGDPPTGGGGTFTPTDDATIREGSPNHNYGNNPSVEADGNPRKDALLRFDVSGVGTASVNTATLRLYATDGSNLGGDFVEITSTSGSWNEDTVTWSNAPDGNGISLGSLGKVSPGNWYELNVTPLVDGDGPVSIRISSSSTNGADYASKENSNGNASELVVTTD